MKIRTILPIIALVLLSCKPENKVEKESHISKMNMHGNIQSIKEISFLAISKNGKIIKGDKQRDFPIGSLDFIQSEDFILNFNKEGNITDYVFFDYSGKIDKKDTIKYYSDEIEKEFLKENPEYANDEPASELHFLFKEKGEPLSIRTFKETKGIDRFDKDGNLEYTKYGGLEKVTYKYDVHGNTLEEKTFDENGEVIEEKNYEYKYDNKNNWVEKIIITDKVPKFILVREIKYYP